VVAATKYKAALSEHAERTPVVLGDVCEEGTSPFVSKEIGQRSGRDALAPVGLTDPEADFSVAILLPAHDVSGDLSLVKDPLGDHVVVMADSVPMGCVCFSIPRSERRHGDRIGFELLLEEDLDIMVQDLTQNDAFFLRDDQRSPSICPRDARARSARPAPGRRPRVASQEPQRMSTSPTIDVAPTCSSSRTTPRTTATRGFM
jgi:hypothetical protein